MLEADIQTADLDGNIESGVYFNRDQVDYVAARTAPEYYAEARSRVPYTPWYPTRYLFAGRKEA